MWPILTIFGKATSFRAQNLHIFAVKQSSASNLHNMGLLDATSVAVRAAFSPLQTRRMFCQLLVPCPCSRSALTYPTCQLNCFPSVSCAVSHLTDGRHLRGSA